MGGMLTLEFENRTVRTVAGPDGEPWFVGVDICAALEINNSRDAISRLADDEKGVGNTDTLGGEQSMTVISEPGVYRLVFRSRKAAAERFKRWLAHDVIPMIRRTGRYEAPGASAWLTLEDLKDAETRSAVDTATGVARAAEKIFGKARARATWAMLPLPQVADDPGEVDDLADAVTALLEPCAGGGVALYVLADAVSAREGRACTSYEVGRAVRLAGHEVKRFRPKGSKTTAYGIAGFRLAAQEALPAAA